MLGSYLAIALRSLLRRRRYTALEVVGLGLGMAVCLLALLYFRAERGWDRFHARADRIYLVRTPVMEPGAKPEKEFANTPGRLAPALIEHFPEMEAAVRIAPDTFFPGDPSRLGTGDRVREAHLAYADPSFFDVFTFPVIAGDPRQALADPRAIVLSRRAAEASFGRPDPVGQTVTLWLPYEAVGEVTVAAVVDLPANSSLQPRRRLPAGPWPGWPSPCS